MSGPAVSRLELGRPVVLLGGRDAGETMTAEQRDAAIDGAADPGARPEAERLAELADGYFDDDYPPNPVRYLNSMLRERWKLQHGGSATKWDRCAIAGGVYTVGKVILG